MKMKKRSALIIVATMVLVGVAAVIFYHFHFRQRLVLVTGARIKVYYDVNCTNEFKQGDTLDWGEIASIPGTYNKTLWIKNVGDVNVTLRFDYDRGAHPWMSMYWDYDGSILVVGGVKQVTISLVLPEEMSAGEYWWDGWFQALPA